MQMILATKYQEVDPHFVYVLWVYKENNSEKYREENKDGFKSYPKK